MNTLNLYRADKKGNSTLPEKYCTDGLLTKQINGGDPFVLEKYGWIKSIKSHIVKSDNKLEKFIYETTSFLSFTEKRETAEKYLSTEDKLDYKKIEKRRFNH